MSSSVTPNFLNSDPHTLADYDSITRTLSVADAISSVEDAFARLADNKVNIYDQIVTGWQHCR